MENLHVLIVDDEGLARTRMRDLLEALRVENILEASNGQMALKMVLDHDVDLVLLDIQMPGISGLDVAAQLKETPQPPAVVFVTAHDHHALRAFDLAAFDYLTKPVRKERLQTALERVNARYLTRSTPPPEPDNAQGEEQTLLIAERGGTRRISTKEVLFFKADQKYVTVRTEYATFLIEESLNQLQERWGDHFVRIHRNALVPRRLVRGLHRGHDDTWEVELHKVAERLEVSRRNVAEVRHLITQRQKGEA